MDKILNDVAHAFALPGLMPSSKLISIKSLKRGNINETYVSSWNKDASEKRFIHQKINQHVFPDVERLTNNILLITEHVRARMRSYSASTEDTLLTLVPTRQGAWLWQDEAGDYWRTYEFIENAHSVEFCPNPNVAYEAAAAFGRFQKCLNDIPATKIIPIIPRFQDSNYRLEQLEAAIKADASGRAHQVKAEIAFALEQRAMCRLFSSASSEGSIPVRITHSDPKINNVMLSDSTGRGICVVDLDTCMPGTLLFDYGDLIRSAAIPVAEDELDLGKVQVNLELVQALTEGYVGTLAADLTVREKELLPIAPSVLALNLGMRFLADYLNGDKYFRIARPKHNLERARVQFAIVRSLQEQAANLERCIGTALRKVAVKVA